jgi:putative methylase
MRRALIFRSVTSVDVDPDALALAKENVESVEMEEHIQFIHAQIGSTKVAEDQVGGDVSVFDPSSLIENEEERPDTVVMK